MVSTHARRRFRPRMLCSAGAACLSVVLAAAPASAQRIADSSDDWSIDGSQGPTWYHGYYNLTQDQATGDGVYQADDFIEFTNTAGPAGGAVDPMGNHWNGAAWDLLDNGAAGAGPWTEIGRADTHPNGTNSFPNEEHWTIRRWVSDRAGELAVSWHVRKTNLAGTGVTGYLFVDGELLDQATVIGGDGRGVKRWVTADVVVGSTVDLAVGPVGVCGDVGDGSDGSISILRISDDPGAAGAQVTPLADSQADWSVDGEQNVNGWFYGYYDQRADVETGDGVYAADDFIEFANDFGPLGGPVDPLGNHWNGVAWDLLDNGAAGAGPWTEINCAGGHPAGNGQTDNSVHWAIRRWVSDVDGDLLLRGTIHNQSTAGDGVIGRILHNGEEVFAALSNGTAVRYSVVVSAAAGDTLDFAIDADGGGNLAIGGPDAVLDGSDGSIFTASIGQQEADTEPRFVRGDVDSDGQIVITDGIFLLQSLFVDPTKIVACRDAADADDNGRLELTDAVVVFQWLFVNPTRPPQPPSPSAGNYVSGDCGTDPTTADTFDCAVRSAKCQ